MNTKQKVRSVKGKTKQAQRRATPKIASNKKRNRVPKVQKSRLDAIPKSQNQEMYAKMRED